MDGEGATDALVEPPILGDADTAAFVWAMRRRDMLPVETRGTVGAVESPESGQGSANAPVARNPRA